MDDFGVGKASLEPGRIGALTAQVDLESQGPLVLLHHFDQVQPVGCRPPGRCDPCQPVEQPYIALYPILDSRPQQLYHHLLSARQASRVDLRDRRSRQGLRLELGKNLFHGTAIEPAQEPMGGGSRERRDLILKARKFSCDVIR